LVIFHFALDEGLAQRRHPFFPAALADHGDALEVGVVADAEFQVVPGGPRVPALEVLEPGQQPELAARFGDGGFDRGHENLVVLVVQLAAEAEGDAFGGVGF
jgi:hypothetical protein